ncbi:MAG: squalene/phytoene synthase family protein [Verrucomicrobiae bacterium]|nr:squalene/phytoene synthase family protein [Verrucomicrobiae bacterium]
MATRERSRLIGPLLRDVSRSFYLTLRVLPPELRPAISLAYLFARASDTIADTKVVPRERRRELLVRFRGQFEHGPRPEDLDLVRADLAPAQSLPAEKILLERLDECFAMWGSLPDDDRARIAGLLGVITRGQEGDLVQFPGENERELAAFETDRQLDDYTYAVAGCVGEFWTQMCAAHLPRLAKWDLPEVTSLAIRFGKGLQLTNILRDLPKDLRIGRCYVPRQALAQAGLRPEDLLSPGTEARFRALYHAYLDRTLDHLGCGQRYTLSIPPSLWRLRLACAWPILIGLKTISLLRENRHALDPARRIKISRGHVYGIIVRSLLVCRNDAGLKALFDRLQTTGSRRQFGL